MAASKETRKSPRKATPQADSGAETRAAAPRRRTGAQRAAPLATSNTRTEFSPDELRKLIAETAYYKAQRRGFAPGHELEDWVQAEAEVMQRLGPS